MPQNSTCTDLHRTSSAHQYLTINMYVITESSNNIQCLPSVVTTEPPLLIDASECDGRICPALAAPFPLTTSRWSPRRCRWRRNRLRRNEPELRTPAILLKSVASVPVAQESAMSQALWRRLPSSSILHLTSHTVLTSCCLSPFTSPSICITYIHFLYVLAAACLTLMDIWCLCQQKTNI